jgi:outer membrane cobalamin receptor
MVDAGITPTMIVLDSDEIEHSVTRDVVDMVANTTGVYQKEEGGSINVRGARENSTIYVVDGIRMFGDFSLPRNAIEEITVITGGIPAQFGDATGGVVLITTKSYRNKRN